MPEERLVVEVLIGAPPAAGAPIRPRGGWLREHAPSRRSVSARPEASLHCYESHPRAARPARSSSRLVSCVEVPIMVVAAKFFARSSLAGVEAPFTRSRSFVRGSPPTSFQRVRPVG